MKEKDYINQVELLHLSGRLGLTEMQDILNHKEPHSKVGKDVVSWIQADLITIDSFQGLVTHIEECSTANLMEQF